MHNAAAGRPHPETAVAIAKHSQDTEPRPRSGESIYHLRFPISQPHDRACCGDQESASFAVGHALHSSIEQARHYIKLRRSGLPSPHTRLQPDPEIPFTVLMQAEDAVANTGDFRIAPDAAIPNFAEPSIARPIRTNPYRAVMIFNESTDLQSMELRILNELAFIPAC